MTAPSVLTFLDLAAEGMDALICDWSGSTSYAFPPPSVLDRVVRLVLEQRADTQLIAPTWRSAVWWPMLMSAEPVVLALPPGTQPFVPGPSGCGRPWAVDSRGPKW